MKHHCGEDFLTSFSVFLKCFISEHTALPNYKGSGGQCWTNGLFSLHRQWTQKGQLPPLAAGEIFDHL